MRKLVPFVFLAVLAGCSGGGADRKVIEELIRTPNSKPTADSMKFSDWGNTTLKDGDKTWKIVRVKYNYKPGGTGDTVFKDVLVRYLDKPLMPLDIVDNNAGDDWKKDLSSVKWPG